MTKIKRTFCLAFALILPLDFSEASIFASFKPGQSPETLLSCAAFMPAFRDQAVVPPLLNFLHSNGIAMRIQVIQQTIHRIGLQLGKPEDTLRGIPGMVGFLGTSWVLIFPHSGSDLVMQLVRIILATSLRAGGGDVTQPGEAGVDLDVGNIQPVDEKFTSLRSLISQLAYPIVPHHDWGTENKELYKAVSQYLGMQAGVAIDVGSGGNNLPAEGLVEAGLHKVIRIDFKFQMGGVGTVTEKIEKQHGDATALPLADNSIDVAVYNQSLSFITHEYVSLSDAGGRFLTDHLDLLEQYRRTGNAPEEVQQAAGLAALKEAYRVLKPGGWIWIKPGNHMDDVPRDLETSTLWFLLEKAGFQDIEVFRHAAKQEAGQSAPVYIPVFLIARNQRNPKHHAPPKPYPPRPDPSNSVPNGRTSRGCA